ncbi:MAG: hypothetical protein HY319_09545 [Armatimonadetes bacterium]|nr:hypothetical protein [Armatimonadota bacterium]
MGVTSVRATEEPKHETRGSSESPRAAEPRRDSPAGERAQPRRQEKDRVQLSEESRGPERDGRGGVPGLLRGLADWAGESRLGDTLETGARMVEKGQQLREREVRGQHRREWNDVGDVRRNLRQNRDLTTYSDDQLRGLDVLAQADERTGGLVRNAAADTVSDVQSLDQLPENQGFQSVLRHQVLDSADGRAPASVERAAGHLQQLATDEARGQLENRLEGREGDDEADQALDAWGTDVTRLARSSPALQDVFLRSVDKISADEGITDRIEDIREADDSLFTRAVGTVGGALGDVKDAVQSGIEDGGRFLADKAGDVIESDNPLVNLASGPIGQLGLAENALRKVGLDAPAEIVNDVRGGAAGFAGSTIETGSQTLAHPVSTAKGLVELGKHSPTLAPARALIEGRPVGDVLDEDLQFYKGVGDAVTEDLQQTYREHGIVGALTHLGGEVALAVGTGGAGNAAKEGVKAGVKAGFKSGAARLAARAGEQGRLSRLTSNLGKLEKPARVAKDAAGFLDSPLQHVADLLDSKMLQSLENLSDRQLNLVKKTRAELNSAGEDAEQD